MHDFGTYLILLKDSVVRREGFPIMFKLIVDECIKIGYHSVLLIAIVSTFTGIVTTIQTAYNFDTPFLPDYLIAIVVRDLVFGVIPTLMALVFAGKVGSSIAGELGTMRITEQIDALEVMGINSANYLVLPKVIASVVMFPVLIVMSSFLALVGGYLICLLTGVLSGTDFVYGIRSEFNGFIINFSLVKAVAFGFLVSSISSYKGFFTQGGALEVGQASTKAVVSSCISIIGADFLLTQIFVV